MLSTHNGYTLDEVLDSLNFFIEEYLRKHNIWFTTEDSKRLTTLRSVKNCSLVDYAKLLYPYVFEQRFDLTGTDFCYPDKSYPSLYPPETLFIAAHQLHSFWMSFLGDDFYGPCYHEEKAKPFNILAVESILRLRVDFAVIGSFSARNLHVKADAASIPEMSSPFGSLFTTGEIEYLSGISSSTLRGRTSQNTSANVFLPALSSSAPRKEKDLKEEDRETIDTHNKFAGFRIPDYLESFFSTKIDSGAKTLVHHCHVSTFLALEGTYNPTKFYYSTPSPGITIPDYSDSRGIYEALLSFPDRRKIKIDLIDMAYAIYAPFFSRGGKSIFFQSMEKGKAKLNLCNLALINDYLAKQEGGYNDENPFSPLLDNL